MKRTIKIAVILTELALLFSCTDFQEVVVQKGLMVDKQEMAFSYGVDSQSLTVQSGLKWEISKTPGWIRVLSITSSQSYSYGWTINLESEQNTGYDRSGQIIITTQKESITIGVAQKGQKGVFIDVESVSLSPSEVSLTIGDSVPLTCTITPSNATVKDVVWSSGDTSVAMVSSSGVVTAKSIGKTAIIVKTPNGGKSAVCAVTVKSSEFDDPSEWSVIGSFNSWGGDLEMVTNGTLHVAKAVAFSAGTEWKFRKNADWAVNFGYAEGVSSYTLGEEFAVGQDGANIIIAEDGVFDLILDPENATAKVIASIAVDQPDPPTPEEGAHYDVDNASTNFWLSSGIGFTYWYSAGDWSGQLAPEYEWINGDQKDFKVVIPEGIGGSEWQGQTHFTIDHPASADKFYDFCATLNATEPSTVTVKLAWEGNDNDNAFFYVNNFEVKAFEDCTFKMPNIQPMGKDGAPVDYDKIALFFDFGRTPAGTEVEIKDVCFQEHQEPVKSKR